MDRSTRRLDAFQVFQKRQTQKKRAPLGEINPNVANKRTRTDKNTSNQKAVPLSRLGLRKLHKQITPRPETTLEALSILDLGHFVKRADFSPQNKELRYRNITQKLLTPLLGCGVAASNNAIQAFVEWFRVKRYDFTASEVAATETEREYTSGLKTLLDPKNQASAYSVHTVEDVNRLGDFLIAVKTASQETVVLMNTDSLITLRADDQIALPKASTLFDLNGDKVPVYATWKTLTPGLNGTLL